MTPILMYRMYTRQNEPVSIKSVHFVFEGPSMWMSSVRPLFRLLNRLLIPNVHDVNYGQGGWAKMSPRWKVSPGMSTDQVNEAE